MRTQITRICPQCGASFTRRLHTKRQPIYCSKKCYGKARTIKRDDGRYVYAYLREDGSPYYIGQGVGKRIHTTSGAEKRRSLPPRERRIFLKKNLSQEEAWRYEKYYIFLYGRERDGGILINRSPGGKYPGLDKHTPETRRRMREAQLGKKQTEEHRRKHSLTNKRLYKEGKLPPPPSQEKPFAFISPSGIINRGTNIRQFADENGLSVNALYDVRRGRQKQHKGWRKA